MTSANDSLADVIVLGVGTCEEDLSLRLLDAGLRVVGMRHPSSGESARIGRACRRK